MAFLAPAFLAGLIALAIPVLIHLIHRERKQVVEFPSLMFLRKIPYKSVRRQRLRRLLLLALRCLALIFLVAAFARPFLPRNDAIPTSERAREVVILLDRSYSMGYGDRFERARAAAARVIDGLAPADRATLVLFDTHSETPVRSTNDKARLKSALTAAGIGSGATRYGPALKLAQSVLGGSEMARRELVLITDFQRIGWQDAEPVQLPPNTVVTPISVADGRTANVAVTGVSLERADSAGRERVRITARLANRSAEPRGNVRVALEIDERELQSRTVSLPASGAALAVFDAFSVGPGNIRATVRAAADALPADDAYNFVLSAERALSVLLLEGAQAAPSASLYLHRALSIGGEPPFRVTLKSYARFQPADLAGTSVVVLNDATVPSGEAGRRLQTFVENGGGLLIVAGEHGGMMSPPDWLPGRIGPVVDRAAGRPGTLGSTDPSSPVFEIFTAPRSGDFAAARFFRYRALLLGSDARALARFDDGAPALAEKRVGRGSVLVWTSTLDNDWNDLALQPVYLPFVHQIVRHLSGRNVAKPAYTAGQLVDLSEFRSDGPAGTTPSADELVVLSPSGSRSVIRTDAGLPALELREQGFYEVRGARTGDTRSLLVASNVDPVESDLTAIDAREILASLGTSTGNTSVIRDSDTPADNERRQSMWRWLLMAVLLLLVAETVFSNRLQRERVVTPTKPARPERGPTTSSTRSRRTQGVA